MAVTVQGMVWASYSECVISDTLVLSICLPRQRHSQQLRSLVAKVEEREKVPSSDFAYDWQNYSMGCFVDCFVWKQEGFLLYRQGG